MDENMTCRRAKVAAVEFSHPMTEQPARAGQFGSGAHAVQFSTPSTTLDPSPRHRY